MVDVAASLVSQAGDVSLSVLWSSSARLSEHMLIAPEGDTRRRRHAHSECVAAARERGQLPSREEWRRTQPRRPSLWSRLLGRV